MDFGYKLLHVFNVYQEKLELLVNVDQQDLKVQKEYRVNQ